MCASDLSRLTGHSVVRRSRNVIPTRALEFLSLSICPCIVRNETSVTDSLASAQRMFEAAIAERQAPHPLAIETRYGAASYESPYLRLLHAQTLIRLCTERVPDPNAALPIPSVLRRNAIRGVGVLSRTPSCSAGRPWLLPNPRKVKYRMHLVLGPWLRASATGMKSR